MAPDLAEAKKLRLRHLNLGRYFGKMSAAVLGLRRSLTSPNVVAHPTALRIRRSEVVLAQLQQHPIAATKDHIGSRNQTFTRLRR